MTARTHDLAAITAFGFLISIYPMTEVNVATLLVALLANQFGGIMPDIDQPTAPFWRNISVGKVFGKFFGKVLGGHRFLTHSLVGMALAGFLLWHLLLLIHPIMPRVSSEFVWWAFMVGMLSHLIMDSLTKEGVPWLLPIPVKFGVPPVKRLRITTGKYMEKVFFVGLVGIDAWLCAVFYTQIVALTRSIILKG